MPLLWITSVRNGINFHVCKRPYIFLIFFFIIYSMLAAMPQAATRLY